MLGLVDDIIGVSESGYKAVQLNALINEKTAVKCLQFGVKKCKSMFVGVNKEQFLNSDLYVDKWAVDYKEDNQTGEEELLETFVGENILEKTNEQKYLGFVLSAIGDNMANINSIKKKSIGNIKKIMNKLNSLNLMNYYFECSLVFLKVMLRPGNLYASKTYYCFSEMQIRHIERIEEGYLRQILKTTKGCPIVQMYLEVGLVPARFEIQRSRLLWLKTILEQNENSMLYKFFYLQKENPIRGDWFSTCISDMKIFKLDLSLEEIKLMKKSKFNKLISESIKQSALSYLRGKQGNKGSDITYKVIQMADYLLPDNNLSIDDKRKLFEIRNGMTQIPSNFSSRDNVFYCVCGDRESMPHVYQCETLNKQNTKSDGESFNKIYNGNINEMIKVYRKFEENLKIREDIMKTDEIDEEKSKSKTEKIKKRNETSKSPCDPSVDPLIISNG